MIPQLMFKFAGLMEHHFCPLMALHAGLYAGHHYSLPGGSVGRSMLTYLSGIALCSYTAERVTLHLFLCVQEPVWYIIF